MSAPPKSCSTNSNDRAGIGDGKTGLTPLEKSTNYETYRHIEQVRNLLNQCIVNLLNRAKQHDQSKLTRPELPIFAIYTPKLAATTYGSEEYQTYLDQMQVALDCHYEQNSHHPEHYPEGVNDMCLFDVLEMLCDWRAATLRHNDGCIWQSIEINTRRFGLSPQLKTILQNTAKQMGW